MSGRQSSRRTSRRSTRRRTQTFHVVARHRGLHHFNRAARQTERHPHQGSGARPIHQGFGTGDQKTFIGHLGLHHAIIGIAIGDVGRYALNPTTCAIWCCHCHFLSVRSRGRRPVAEWLSPNFQLIWPTSKRTGGSAKVRTLRESVFCIPLWDAAERVIWHLKNWDPLVSVQPFWLKGLSHGANA